MTDTAVRNQLPRTNDDFASLLVFGLDLADKHGITLVSIQAANFGGLDLHANSMAEVDVLADALNLNPEDPEDKNYTRGGVLPGVLDLPVPVRVYSGRR